MGDKDIDEELALLNISDDNVLIENVPDVNKMLVDENSQHFNEEKCEHEMNNHVKQDDDDYGNILWLTGC